MSTGFLVGCCGVEGGAVGVGLKLVFEGATGWWIVDDNLHKRHRALLTHLYCSHRKEPFLKKHWIPLAGARWVCSLPLSAHLLVSHSLTRSRSSRQEFRTESHRVTIVFKTAALGAHELRGR